MLLYYRRGWLNILMLLGFMILLLRQTPCQAQTSQPLLAQAQRVPSFEVHGVEYWAYRWISNRTYLLSKEGNSNPLPYIRQFYYGDRFTSALSLMTNSEPGLPVEGFEGPDASEFSPDGQFLLWSRFPGETLYPIMAVQINRKIVGKYYDYETRMDVSHPEGRPMIGEYFGWLSDSRRWIELVDTSSDQDRKQGHKRTLMRLHDMRTLAIQERRFDLGKVPFTISDYPNTGPSIKAWNIVSLTPTLLLLDNCPLVIDATGEAYPDRTGTSKASFVKNLRLVLVAIAPKVKVVKQYTLTCPPKTILLRRALSPKGDMVACCLLPQAHPDTEELWVYRLKEAVWHKVGAVAYAPAEKSKMVLTALQWLPDGKSVSFVYKEALYTVPIPPGK